MIFLGDSLKAFSAYPKLEISLLIAGEIGAETRLEKELTKKTQVRLVGADSS